jgi:hypothetical protein
MDAKDLPLDDCSQRKVIKRIVEIMPNIVIAILFCYFVVEAVYIGNVTGFMVTPHENYSLRIF